MKNPILLRQVYDLKKPTPHIPNEDHQVKIVPLYHSVKISKKALFKMACLRGLYKVDLLNLFPPKV
ncbi:MAG: hypothetical protein C4B58_11800 [Deltaproteobacteria bacterium]|nr:MAG: hypothetical protein C4B58_11800 [Deltaproteobacteria bacterium]